MKQKKRYNVLAIEGQLYLPPIKDFTQRFLRLIIEGTSFMLNEVKNDKIPPL